MADWEDAIFHFRRKEKLTFEEIRPVILIRSPRDMEKVKKSYDRIDNIDRVWFKYYTPTEVQRECNRFVETHPEYTHIIITSDDITFSPKLIKQLIADILEYDFPILTACCNFCDVWYREDRACSWCRTNRQHPYINITFDKPNLTEWGSVHSYTDFKQSYNLISERWRQNNPIIKQVWFQGLALTVIRRDVYLKVGGLKPWGKHTTSDDITFCFDCEKMKIPQFCDFRAFAHHWGTHHKKLKVGKEKSKTIIEYAKSVKRARILMVTPFNNEDHSIPKHVEALKALQYPQELIDLVWLENDSEDDTWKLLRKYAKEIRKECKFHSFQLIKKDYGLKLGKLTNDEAAKVWGGKNRIYLSREIAISRAKKIVKMYEYLFSLLTPKHDYWLMFMADILPPPNAINRFLEVFEAKEDAGWLGGLHHRRYPRHMRKLQHGDPNAGGLGTIMRDKTSSTGFRYPIDEEIIEMINRGKIVFEVGMTGHFFMIKSDIIRDGARFGLNEIEVGVPFIEKIWEMGYKLYCASDVYLEHVSLDGKIYRHNLYEEIEYVRQEAEIKRITKKKEYLQVKVKKRLEVEVKKPEEKKSEEVVPKKGINAEELESKLFKNYETFVLYHLKRNQTIPPRPRFPESRISDNLSGQSLNQEQWDKLYGSWLKYIENPQKYPVIKKKEPPKLTKRKLRKMRSRRKK